MTARTICSIVALCIAGSATTGAEQVPFDSTRWTIDAEDHRLERYKGRDCLWITRGTALLPESRLENGILEVDVALPEVTHPR